MKKFLIVLLVILLGICTYFVYDKFFKEKTKFNLSKNVKSNDNINFILDLSNNKKGDITEYKISNKLTIKLEFIGIEDFDSLNYYRYKFIVNDNYILEDGTTGDERKISILNNYLILKNDQNTDQRSTKLFIYSFDGKKVDDIFQLEDDEGMITKSYEVNDVLKITGTRLTYNNNFVYNGKTYTACNNKLDDSLVLTKEYEYTISNNKLELKNEKEIEILKDYKKNNCN